MLMATVYLATLGKQGLQELAEQNLQKAAYAARSISQVDGFSLLFSSPHFNEFVVKTPRPAAEIVEELLSQDIIAGLPLGRYYPKISDMSHALLLCVTERNSKAQIDQLVTALKNL